MMPTSSFRASATRAITGTSIASDPARRRGLWAILFTFVAALTYAIYAQGFNAGWTFDDTKFLRNLAQVDDFDSAMVFVVRDKGISVTDRPISMASFLVNVDDWPDNRQGFRQINLLLHIVNGLLVALIGRRVARLIPGLSNRSNGFAITLAAVWMLHPLLASTSFHIAQRMVLLAAAFSLIGVLMYLKGRVQLAGGNRDGYAWMTAGMLVSAGLGTLAKENAALTPLLVAILEFTVLSRFASISDRFFARWRLLFFGLPALALVVYGIYYLSFVAPGSYPSRPFTLEQRIFSEGVVLFEYLRQILVPDVTVLGPYQDDTWRIRDAGFLTWFALGVWLVLVVTALVWRRRVAAFSFGVLFFLTGHLLESTVIPLELYFEHRNYLPILGPIGALVGVAWAASANWPRYLTVGFAALMALLLLQTSSLWGDEERSASTWHRKHPTSTRATQNLAGFHQRSGNLDVSSATVIEGYRRNPMDGSLAFSAITSLCFDTPTTRHNLSVLDQVAQDAPNIHFYTGMLRKLHGQISLIAQGDCDSIDAESLIAITRGLLENRAFQKPIRQYGLLMAIARAQQTQGKAREATDTKISAFRVAPNIKAARTIFHELVRYGDTQGARQFLLEAHRRAPEFGDHYDAWEGSLQTNGDTDTPE